MALSKQFYIQDSHNPSFVYCVSSIQCKFYIQLLIILKRIQKYLDIQCITSNWFLLKMVKLLAGWLASLDFELTKFIF